MTEKLTGRQLEAIRQRAKAATGGDWYWDEGYEQDIPGRYVYCDEGAIVASADVLEEDDAEFIAHARTDIPALLAEIERLNDVIRSIGAQWKKDRKDYAELSERERSRAEIYAEAYADGQRDQWHDDKAEMEHEQFMRELEREREAD